MGCRWLLIGYCLHITIISCSNVVDENIVEKWEKLENNLQTIVDSLIERFLPVANEYFPAENISSECREALSIVFSGIRRLQTWALKFLDSTGRPMANVMSGSFSSPGLFDECISIQVSDEISQLYGNKSKLSFRGQYCSINFRPPLPPKPKMYSLSKPLPEFIKFENSDQLVEWGGYKIAQIFYFLSFRFGICLPSTCSRKDIKEIIDVVAKSSISLTSEINHCEVKEYNVWTKEQIVACVILAIPVTFALVGTCVSAYLKLMKIQFITIAGRSRKTLTRMLEAFSLRTNMIKIMNTENTDGALSCLHGIRFLSLAWVVIGHTYYFACFQQIRNMKVFPDIAGSPMFQLIVNSTPSVDTFFFMSGLLLVYVALEKLNSMNRQTISIPFLIWHRIWRLWPPMITTILFVFFLPWIGSGPYWHETIDTIVDNCKHRWWTVVIFINNFIPGKECLPHTWYASCDLQLYIFGVFSLAILLRRPILAFTVNAVVSVIGMAIVGYFTKIHEFPPTMLYDRVDKEERRKLMNLIYFRPYAHVGVYSIGMAVGYLLHKRKQISIKPIFKFLGWIVAIACNLTILLATTTWNRGNEISPVVAVVYASLHRTAWGIGLAWLTILCCTGNCEILRKFLSWGLFIPLSRLSFFAYLLHYLVVNVAVMINRQSYHAEQFYVVSLFLSNLTVTYLLSLLASPVFESPLLALEKIMFSAGRKTTNDAADKIQESSHNTTENCYDNQIHIQSSTSVSQF